MLSERHSDARTDESQDAACEGWWRRLVGVRRTGLWQGLLTYTPSLVLSCLVAGVIATIVIFSGASIRMGQGGHVPPIFGLGDIITNVPLNISRVISATFYPCNIFLIS